MRLQELLMHSRLFGQLQSNARLLSFLGIDTVCYAPPALYPVPGLPGRCVGLASPGAGHDKNKNKNKKRLLYPIAGSATCNCRFSKARTLTASCLPFKAFFPAPANMFFSNSTDITPGARPPRAYFWPTAAASRLTSSISSRPMRPSICFCTGNKAWRHSAFSCSLRR